MRVLIAEDEFLVGIQLEEDLRSAGCSILGPFSTLATATRASRGERFDLAILDVNLNGEMVYPLAEELSARGVPVILLSGYISADLPERYRRWPQIMKPHDPAVLIKEIRSAVPGQTNDRRARSRRPPARRPQLRKSSGGSKAGAS